MARLSVLRFALLGAIVLAGAGALWYTVFREVPPTPSTAPGDDEAVVADPAPPDPRLTYSTIFRNVKPDVRYVGDAKCAGCHGDICTSYHAHPMGRSAVSVAGATPIEKYDAGAKNPWKDRAYELRVTKTPDGDLHSVSAKDGRGGPLPDYTIPANLAIGSGTRGRSYLSIEDGTVWQSPISWFSKKSRWDISPGFDLGNGGRRAIVPGCLYCHVNDAQPIPHAVNRFREPLSPVQTAIGCERCHGPGELHVTERTAGKSDSKLDTSIVNPKHLSAALQVAICEQCHLQGQERIVRRGRSVFEFRPGLPFEQFVSVFVRHPDFADMSRSVGQFEQLKLSKCSIPTGERLLCTSCHDPHKSPAVAERDGYYRARCLTCHESKGCKAPLPDRRAKSDSCAACHMPQAGSSNIAHTSITDHRILRRPTPAPPSKGLPPGTVPLVHYHAAAGAANPEVERDLAIALSRLAEKLPPGTPTQQTQQILSKLARDRLATSLGTWRGDADAWLAMSLSHAGTGEAGERLAAAERAVRLEPDSEAALIQVAEAALGMERYDRAEEAATKLIALNPRSVDHLLSRATISTVRKRWEKAEEDCRAALRIQPLHPTARLILAVNLHQRGNVEAGKKEFETAIGLATQQQQKSAFREWFLRETR